MGGAIQLDVSALIVSSFYKQEMKMIGTRCDLGFSVYNKFRCCTIPGLLSSFLYTSNNGVAKDRPGWACPISRGSHLYVPCSSLAGVSDPVHLSVSHSFC